MLSAVQRLAPVSGVVFVGVFDQYVNVSPLGGTTPVGRTEELLPTPVFPPPATEFACGLESLHVELPLCFSKLTVHAPEGVTVSEVATPNVRLPSVNDVVAVAPDAPVAFTM